MKRHYGMKTERFAVEAEFSADGYAELVEIRRTDPRFKGRRIREWIQAFPDHRPLLTVFERT